MELHLPKFPFHPRLAPLAVVTGTLVPGFIADSIYAPWLRLGTTQVFALSGGGLGHLDDTYDQLEPRLIAFYRRHGRFVVVGHSQGGYHAMRFAATHPEMVYEVISVCGAHSGVERHIWPAQLLRWVFPGRDVEVELHVSSEQIEFLAAQVALDWSEQVGLTLVVAAHDLLILPHRLAHQVVLPAGQAARRIFVGHRRPTGLPDDHEHRWAPPPLAGHSSIILTAAVIGLIIEVRLRHALAASTAQPIAA